MNFIFRLGSQPQYISCLGKYPTTPQKRTKPQTLLVQQLHTGTCHLFTVLEHAELQGDRTNHSSCPVCKLVPPVPVTLHWPPLVFLPVGLFPWPFIPTITSQRTILSGKGVSYCWLFWPCDIKGANSQDPHHFESGNLWGERRMESVECQAQATRTAQ